MRKIGLLCLALVLALGTLGVGYALWSEDLYIDGYIETGDVDVDWSLVDWWADDPKDASSIDAYIIDDTLYVDIYNAYPSIWYYVMFDIHCVGSVPVHLGDFVISRGNLPSLATLNIYMIDWPDWPIVPIQLHESNVAYGVIEIHLDNDAAENATYTFSAQITAGQWNEFP